MDDENLDDLVDDVVGLVAAADGEQPDRHCCADCFDAGARTAIRALEIAGIDVGAAVAIHKRRA